MLSKKAKTYLLEGEGVVGNKGQDGGSSDDILHLERVETGIIGGLELDLHQIDNVH